MLDFQTKKTEVLRDHVTCQGSPGIEAGPGLPLWYPSSKSCANGELCNLHVGILLLLPEGLLDFRREQLQGG